MQNSPGRKRLINFLSPSIVLFILFLFAFCITGYIALHDSPLKFDAMIFAGLQSIRSAAMTNFMVMLTFFGSKYFLFPFCSLLVIYEIFFCKKLWLGVAFAGISFFGNQLLFLMQDTFKRVRPSHPLISNVNGYGYPSGHSFASFTIACLLIFLVWQKDLKTRWKFILTAALLISAILIATSRIYLHVHYPTDVLGGFYLSILWMIPCLWMIYFIQKKYQ